MGKRKTILAISGSTRINSSNSTLIEIIAILSAAEFEVRTFDGLADLPAFNPDLDTEPAPEPVASFRNQLRTADGVLICTPEYAMGVPGALKNAIDWTVSSMEFSQKPVALITASSQGEKAHASLIETLKVIEAGIPENSTLLISFIKGKLKDKQITDPETLNQIKDVMKSFGDSIQAKINLTSMN